MKIVSKHPDLYLKYRNKNINYNGSLETVCGYAVYKSKNVHILTFNKPAEGKSVEDRSKLSGQVYIEPSIDEKFFLTSSEEQLSLHAKIL